MTIIVRKNNIIATDSLIFEGRPEGPSVSYKNKIKKNKAGTMLIIYSGNNYEGDLLNLLNLTSNIIYNLLIENKLPSIENIPESLILLIKSLTEDNLDFSCLFVCKSYTFHLKSYLEAVTLYTHPENELVYFGGGACYISYINFCKNTTSPITLVQKVIDKVGSCNGHIHTFDLNLLRDIKI